MRVEEVWRYADGDYMTRQKVRRLKQDKRRYPGDAVLSGVLLLQSILLQRLHHSKVSGVSCGEEDGLIRDVGLQAVGIYP